MNFKTTLWLLAVAAVLGGYIFFVELHAPKSAERVRRAILLFPDTDPGSVTAIEIVHTNWFLRAERAGDQWRLTKPIAYPAQTTSIRHFLQTVSRLEKDIYISREDLSGETSGKASYGLADPLVKVSIEQGTNRLGFQIGSRTLVKDQLYLQLKGDLGVYVTSAAVLGTLPNSISDWRNPMLDYEDSMAFDRVTVTNTAGVFEIQRDPTNDLWRLTKPLSDRADFNALSDLIQLLRGTRVEQFIDENPRTDLERYGLLQPKADLSLFQNTNQIFEVQFGNSPTNNPSLVFARHLGHSNVVLVSRQILDLVQESHEKYRDHTLALFNPALVSRIEFAAQGARDEKFALDRQTNDVWRIAEPFDAPADPELVRNFLEDLGRLRIAKFEKDVVTDFSVYGLEKPKREYILRRLIAGPVGMTNALLAHIAFGSNTLETVYTRRGDEKSVYGVSYPDSNRLPRAAYQLRDRRMWSFDGTNVTAISVNHHGKTRRLTRTSSGWTTDVVANAALEETLHRLGQLRVTEWRGKDDPELMKAVIRSAEHDVTIEVNSGGKAITYSMAIGKTMGKNSYASTVLEEGKPVIFLLPSSIYDNILRDLSIAPENPSAP